MDNADKKQASEKLHIFVNRVKFDEGDGVMETMNGREIAALVKVPAEKAVVKLETGPDKREIGLDEPVPIKNGLHFLVTRDRVEGGYVA